MHFLPAIFQVNQPIHQKIKFQRNDQFPDPVRASRSAQNFSKKPISGLCQPIDYWLYQLIGQNLAKKSQFPVCGKNIFNI
jgi:hypothetical protein